MSNKEDLVYNKLVDKLSKTGNEVTVNPVNILPMVVQTISLTEKYVNESGEQKKEIVYNVLNKLLENVEVNDKEEVLKFLTNSLSVFIDTTVNVFKGSYSFKYKPEFCRKLKELFSCTK